MPEKEEFRDKKTIGTGFSDNFEPCVSLDLSKCKTVNDLVKGMSKTSFQGRQLGEAADVFEAMVKDKDCFVVLTLSGAMTVAKMGLVVCDMIENGMVNAIVSTGALMAHGFIESLGKTHFKYESGMMDDKKLYKAGYDRVYDTLELEKNLDDIDDIFKEVVESIPEGTILSSRLITEKLGEYLHKNVKGRGILKSAFEKKVPIYIPAFTDSELGIDFGMVNRLRKKEGKKELQFNPFLDLEHFTELILKQKRTGIFTVGGGVPRNWAQQVGPYLDDIRYTIRDKKGPDSYFAEKDDPYLKRYRYGVRICPEPVHWGGLSGATYSEGVSWGKFVPKEEGGRWSEVFCDATIAWPLIVKAVMERLNI